MQQPPVYLISNFNAKMQNAGFQKVSSYKMVGFCLIFNQKPKN